MFHVNSLHSRDSHEISSLIFSDKQCKNIQEISAAVVTGALRVYALRK